MLLSVLGIMVSRQIDIKNREGASEQAESARWPRGAAGDVQQVQAWASCMDVTRTEWSEAGRSRDDEECCMAVTGWWNGGVVLSTGDGLQISSGNKGGAKRG